LDGYTWIVKQQQSFIESRKYTPQEARVGLSEMAQGFRYLGSDRNSHNIRSEQKGKYGWFLGVALVADSFH
jgi:hypothetical protein